MAEYIEREAVLNALYDNEYTTLCPLDEVSSVICAIPAADVLEVPPVKIGDKAFFVIEGRIYEAEICLVAWNQYRAFTHTEIRGELYPHHTVSASFEEFGKVVFLTREEAVEVIQKMNGERREQDA